MEKRPERDDSVMRQPEDARTHSGLSKAIVIRWTYSLKYRVLDASRGA